MERKTFTAWITMSYGRKWIRKQLNEFRIWDSSTSWQIFFFVFVFFCAVLIILPPFIRPDLGKMMTFTINFSFSSSYLLYLHKIKETSSWCVKPQFLFFFVRNFIMKYFFYFVSVQKIFHEIHHCGRHHFFLSFVLVIKKVLMNYELLHSANGYTYVV